MGLLNLTESERLEILNLHNNAKIIKEQASTATTTAPTDDKSKIMAIQTALNTKYKSNLKVDGILGQKTLTALSTAMKSKSAGTPAATTGTAAPAATTGTAAPAATTQGADEFGAGAPQPQLSAQSQQALSGQLTPQQIRQQGRFDQRLARQARRTAKRAGQQ